MNNLEKLIPRPGARDAAITVYKNRVSLNARACFQLQLGEVSRVNFCKKGDSVYVSRENKPNSGSFVRFREGRKGGMINSTELAGLIAYAGGGHGVYRLVTDDAFLFRDGVRYFRLVHTMDAE